MSGLHNGDLIVVLPGITGSALVRREAGETRQVWGYRRFTTGLGWPKPRVSTLVAKLTEDLALGAGAFDDYERGLPDGVEADGPMMTQGVIPGFWTIQGYDRLLLGLRMALDAGADEVFAHPYDWRQSNRVSAHGLKAAIDPLVKARRATYPDASVIFVCHSMGGLVARYYAQVLDDQRYTRRVVTIGTPYQGAVKALVALANGFGEMAGRRVEIGELVRSWPSVAELLPMYPCLGASEVDLRPLTRDAVIGGLPVRNLNHGLDFHQELAATEPRPMLYRAIFGYHQPTNVWASLVPEDAGMKVEPHRNADPLQQGDGTVPRCSSWPPEWDDESLGVSPSVERHGGLQQAAEVIRQLVMLATIGKGRTTMAGDHDLSVEADDLVEPGQPWQIEAWAPNGSDRLALEVKLYPHSEGSDDRHEDRSSEGAAPEPEPIAMAKVHADPDQRGRYVAQVPIVEPGLYRWEITSMRRALPQVEPVSDLVLCLDE